MAFNSISHADLSQELKISNSFITLIPMATELSYQKSSDIQDTAKNQQAT